MEKADEEGTEHARVTSVCGEGCGGVRSEGQTRLRRTGSDFGANDGDEEK